MTRKSNYQTILWGLTFVLSGCSLFYRGDQQLPRGVPLQHFVAKDGDYFPAHIKKFFPGAELFETLHPTLKNAGRDIQLIEVRALTEGNLASNEANLSWSVDGAYLGYEVITDRNREILVKDLVGDYSKLLSVTPPARGDFLDGMVLSSIQSYNASLRWSFDSTRFTFMSNGGIGQYNIYVGAVGEKEKIITKSPTKDGYASWSPVTNEIVFVSARSGHGDLYLINLDKNKLTRLTDSPAVDLFPEWASDGHSIVYSSGDALVHDLMVVNRGSDGQWQKPYKLTDWAQDDLRPILSPDGKYVAFYADEPGLREDEEKIWNLHVIPFVPGKTYKDFELSKSVVAKDVIIDLNTGPAWSPDSQKVFFVSHAPESFNPIFGYDLNTSKRYILQTQTKMNRDLIMSRLGILSFRAQTGVWDRVYLALTNQGAQLQGELR